MKTGLVFKKLILSFGQATPVLNPQISHIAIGTKRMHHITTSPPTSLFRFVVATPKPKNLIMKKLPTGSKQDFIDVDKSKIIPQNLKHLTAFSFYL